MANNGNVALGAARGLTPHRGIKEALFDLSAPKLMNQHPPSLQALVDGVPKLVARGRGANGKDRLKRDIINVGLVPVLITLINSQGDAANAAGLNTSSTNYHYPLAPGTTAHDGRGGAYNASSDPEDVWAVAYGGAGIVSVVLADAP